MKYLVSLMSLMMASCSTSNISWLEPVFLPNVSEIIPNPGLAGPVVGIIGKELFIAGGANFPDLKPWEGGKKVYQKQVYVYDIKKENLTFLRQENIEEVASYSGICNMQNAIYTAGGETENGPVDWFKKISIRENKLVQEDLPNLPLPITNGGLVEALGIFYFVGGENQEKVSDKVYIFKDNHWEEKFTLPYPVSNAVILSNHKDKIYIVGGRMRNFNATSTIYDQILEIDLISEEISVIGKLPKATAAGTGVILKNGNLLLFGGDTAETFHQVESLIAQANLADNQEEKDSLNAEKIKVLSSHPGFKGNCWEFNTNEKKITALESIPTESPVTTTAVLFHDVVIIPSGEVRAGVRTPQILVGVLKNRK